MNFNPPKENHSEQIRLNPLGMTVSATNFEDPTIRNPALLTHCPAHGLILHHGHAGDGESVPIHGALHLNVMTLVAL